MLLKKQTGQSSQLHMLHILVAFDSEMLSHGPKSRSEELFMLFVVPNPDTAKIYRVSLAYQYVTAAREIPPERPTTEVSKSTRQPCLSLTLQLKENGFYKQSVG